MPKVGIVHRLQDPNDPMQVPFDRPGSSRDILGRTMQLEVDRGSLGFRV